MDILHFHLTNRTQDCMLGHQEVHAPVSELTFPCGSITFLLYALVTLSERCCTWVRGTLIIHAGLGMRDWEQSWGEGLGVDEKLDMTWQCALTAQESQLCPWLHPKQCGQQGEGGESTPPLLCASTWSAASSSGTQLWASPKQEGCGPVWASPEEARKIIRGLRHLCYADRPRELGLFSLGDRRL